MNTRTAPEKRHLSKPHGHLTACGDLTNGTNATFDLPSVTCKRCRKTIRYRNLKADPRRDPAEPLP